MIISFVIMANCGARFDVGARSFTLSKLPSPQISRPPHFIHSDKASGFVGAKRLNRSEEVQSDRRRSIGLKAPNRDEDALLSRRKRNEEALLNWRKRRSLWLRPRLFAKAAPLTILESSQNENFGSAFLCFWLGFFLL